MTLLFYDDVGDEFISSKEVKLYKTDEFVNEVYQCNISNTRWSWNKYEDAKIFVFVWFYAIMRIL